MVYNRGQQPKQGRRRIVKPVSFGTVKSNDFPFYACFTHGNGWVSGVGVKAGSIHDPRNAIGMNHLVEHIIGGFSNDEELLCEAYACGPDEGINIRVDRSSTSYGHDDLLTRRQMFDLFDIFARNVLLPEKITQETLERERAAVLNEYYLHGTDWLENAIDDWMHALMYEEGTNPASSRIDCEPDQLAKITVRDVQRYYRANYGVDTMFGIVTDVPYKRVKRIAEEKFGHLKPTGRPPIYVPHARPILRDSKRFEVEKKGIRQYHVAIGFPTFPYGHHDDIAIDILGYIWRWRLWEILRIANRKWGEGTYRVRVYTSRTFANGMIYIWFATPSQEFAQKGAEAILRECARLREELVDDKLFAAFKDKLRNLYKYAFEKAPGELYELIMKAACNGDPEMKGLNSYLERLNRVGKKTIRRVANEYFTPNGYVQLVIKPAPSDESNEKLTRLGNGDIKPPHELRD